MTLVTLGLCVVHSIGISTGHVHVTCLGGKHRQQHIVLGGAYTLAVQVVCDLVLCTCTVIEDAHARTQHQHTAVQLQQEVAKTRGAPPL